MEALSRGVQSEYLEGTDEGAEHTSSLFIGRRTKLFCLGESVFDLINEPLFLAGQNLIRGDIERFGWMGQL